MLASSVSMRKDHSHRRKRIPELPNRQPYPPNLLKHDKTRKRGILGKAPQGLVGQPAHARLFWPVS